MNILTMTKQEIFKYFLMKINEINRKYQSIFTTCFYASEINKNMTFLLFLMHPAFPSVIVIDSNYMTL